jgi:hypothetical protein
MLKETQSIWRKAQQLAPSKPAAITPIEYNQLQDAFDYFNTELFDGRLPDVFITYQRRAGSKGYFSANRFTGRTGQSGSREQSGHHELALNPDAFVDRTDEQIASTLVHEQTHVWQRHFGKPGSRGYHNKEWATKMKSIGLQPSTTGAVGGKETGQHVTHYIIPGGPFSKAFEKLAAKGWKLNLQSALASGPNGGNNSKTKFTCPSCGQNAWGKPELAIRCIPCGVPMTAAVQSYDQQHPASAATIAPVDTVLITAGTMTHQHAPIALTAALLQPAAPVIGRPKCGHLAARPPPSASIRK